jgi:subtilisin family serine protease
VASVAALVWGAKPSLTNVQVENILKSTCYKDSSRQVWTESYGYGMPNAEAALKAALGL